MSTPTEGLPAAADVVVVGGGMAGLCAAGELVRGGLRVIVLEKSRGLGGRMATRRVGAAVCDHGAQFFTVRTPEFGGVVAAAAAAGTVATWCDGFARAAAGDHQTAAAADGHSRWRGVRGMTDLPKRLAAEASAAAGGGSLGIHTEATVAGIAAAATGTRLRVVAGSGAAFEVAARGVVLTPPVPQSLALLAAGAVGAESALVGPAARERLGSVAYDPCFALLLELSARSRVPPPGGIQFEPGGPIAWIADNFQKGISPVPALTVHASGPFSREHFERSPEEVAERLLEHVRPWIAGEIGTAVVARSLHRWKFALPTTVLPVPYVVAAESPPIVCCGDAFSGPRVEGAATSGLAAGRWLTGRLAATAG